MFTERAIKNRLHDNHECKRETDRKKALGCYRVRMQNVIQERERNDRTRRENEGVRRDDIMGTAHKALRSEEKKGIFQHVLSNLSTGKLEEESQQPQQGPLELSSEF